eukprot:CAMPEP_0184656592 /NCGR_PEP_ID=MMETSP0308-20130426/16612_1 /TAXON_ID=38269 /ORGANISM="Gloeochaete witrockiana, Strain SAG 46.84" /LENGTH=202 /DNA_ID=CAMNT_0027093779 /DNA_START=181 /DNA_END=789 /DNA_ORIENTATION=-
MVVASQKTVLVPIADGSEEIEAVTIIDVLRRAGATVMVAKVGAGGSATQPGDSLQITASRGVKIVADSRIEELAGHEFDLIAVPGGLPGAEHLRDSHLLIDLLKKQKQEDKLIAAICASPAVVFGTHGLLDGKQATGYPADRFNAALKERGTTVLERPVVTDGKIMTSKGPGTAMVFAVSLIDALYGKEKAKEVAAGLLIDY